MFSLDDPRIEIFLLRWFSGGTYQFGQHRNHYLYNLDEYINFIKFCKENKVPAFQSVQPTLVMEKFFWEFDSKEKIEKSTYDSPELDKIWEQAVKLNMNIIDKGGRPLVVYSGNRGYHVWVFCGWKFREEMEKLAKSLYKNILFDILGDRSIFPDFDPQPAHINALARIPFSYHQKTGNQVVPLTLERKPFIPKVEEYKKNPLEETYMLSMIEKTYEGRLKRTERKAVWEKDSWNVRPCIIEALRKDPTHNARLAYLLDLIYSDASNEDIQNQFSGFSDYDEDKTQYQIDYARDKVKEEDGIKPVSKETLKRWGICNDCGRCGTKNSLRVWMGEKK